MTPCLSPPGVYLLLLFLIQFALIAIGNGQTQVYCPETGKDVHFIYFHSLQQRLTVC
jgi:hypothetical protein